jgi:hypothetical protein
MSKNLYGNDKTMFPLAMGENVGQNLKSSIFKEI